MKNTKNGFDEMQEAQRNRIGNQTFFIMAYLLLLDMGLQGFDFKWLSYPANVMVIITVCMIYFLIRVILGNAYMPPEKERSKSVFQSVILVIIAVALSAVLAFSLARSQFGNESESNDDYSAVILTAVSIIGLLIVGVVSIIKEINNKKNENE